MDNDVLRLKAIFDHLDIELSVSEFNNRLNIQKIIYFTQFAGIEMGYRFSWYRHGPYSTELTETAFRYDEIKKDIDSSMKIELSDSGKEKLNNIHNLIKSNNILELPIWLELLASIHYLKHIAYISKDYVTKNNILKLLENSGKFHFSESNVENAWDILNEQGLISKPRWN